jgi:hypothetical protein
LAQNTRVLAGCTVIFLKLTFAREIKKFAEPRIGRFSVTLNAGRELLVPHMAIATSVAPLLQLPNNDVGIF